MGFAAAIDRAISVFAPGIGVKRAAARQRMQILNSGYGNYGASTFKKSLKGWIFAGGSHREDIEDNLPIAAAAQPRPVYGSPHSKWGGEDHAHECRGARAAPKAQG